MPRTKPQSIVFTAITAWLMVYFMTLYNTVLASGSFTNATFLSALQSMWVEFIIIFLCAFFLSSHAANFLTSRIIHPGYPVLARILFTQTFTVVCQVALASILGVWHAGGFNAQFIPNYLSVYCKNFVMALPLQLLLVGPVARWIFRLIYRVPNPLLQASQESAGRGARGDTRQPVPEA